MDPLIIIIVTLVAECFLVLGALSDVLIVREKRDRIFDLERENETLRYRLNEWEGSSLPNAGPFRSIRGVEPEYVTAERNLLSCAGNHDPADALAHMIICEGRDLEAEEREREKAVRQVANDHLRGIGRAYRMIDTPEYSEAFAWHDR